jgi:hypothetical protein
MANGRASGVKDTSIPVLPDLPSREDDDGRKCWKYALEAIILYYYISVIHN